jgi:hypothetical protein
MYTKKAEQYQDIVKLRKTKQQDIPQMHKALRPQALLSY